MGTPITTKLELIDAITYLLQASVQKDARVRRRLVLLAIGICYVHGVDMSWDIASDGKIDVRNAIIVIVNALWDRNKGDSP